MSFVSGFVKTAAQTTDTTEDTASLKDKLLRVALPAALAGAGTYALLRRKRLHGPKGLQEIQKRSDRVVKIVPGEDVPKGGKKGKLFKSFKRFLDPTEYVNIGNKRAIKKLEDAAIIDLAGGGKNKRAINFVGEKDRRWIKKNISYDKVKEQKWIHDRIDPRLSIPTSPVGKLTDRIKNKSGRLDKIKDKFNDKYFIKERGGFGGMETQSYANPDTVLDEASSSGDVLRDALSKKRSKKYIVQPMQKIKNEYRVHVLGNEVIPGYTMDRQLGSGDFIPAGMYSDVERAVQKAIKDKKLPKGQLYGFDVAEVGKGKFKIIETNPVDSGGYSGFFDQYGTTLGRHANLYKALTGRTAPYRAALAGGAVATGTGIAANQIDNFIEDSKNVKVRGPYKA